MVLFDTAILTGQLAPQSLAGYQQDLTAYLQFCGDPGTALEATENPCWGLPASAGRGKKG
jgi:hypothetical protein